MKRTAMLLAGFGLLVPLMAQDTRPERGVARLSVIGGDVSVRRGDSGEAVAAAVNAPLVVEDRVLTAAGSRAEVQLDYANFLRVGALSEVRMAELSYGRSLVQVARGVVTLRVLRNSQSEVEVSTPSISIRPSKQGTYRIAVSEDGTTEVTVRSGEAMVASPKGSERLGTGRTMLARGNPTDPEFQMVAAIPRDEWDEWNSRRDRDLERSTSYQYVSQDIYGAEDLDNYGRWVNDGAYGWVWVPTVADGWSPYRYGRWSWVDWYGWSWVSYDPWGWAPYHYGRWYHGSHGWCWWPGARHNRYYWSPGLVAFFGWGGYSGVHVGIGLGFGHMGWVPLGPHELYYPWYGRHMYGGRMGYGNVHVVNNINIYNTYRNARVMGGVTGGHTDDFLRGRSAGFGRVSDGDIRSANLVRGHVPVTPGRDSLRMSDREVRAGSMPQSRDGGRFYSTRPASNVQRIPFEQQRQSMGGGAPRGNERVAMGGEVSRPTAGARMGSERTQGAQQSWRRTAEGSANPGASRGTEGNASRSSEAYRGSSGWRRMGEGQQGTQPAENRGAAPSNSGPQRNDGGNWRRFGSSPSSETHGNAGYSTPSARPDNSRTPGQQGSGRWQDFGSSGRGSSNNAPSSQPQQRYSAPQRYESAPGRSNESMRIGGAIVRERPSGPSGYSAPQQRSAPQYSAPQRSAPQSAAPQRSAPQSSPQRSAPQSSGGGRSDGGHRR